MDSLLELVEGLELVESKVHRFNFDTAWRLAPNVGSHWIYYKAC